MGGTASRGVPAGANQGALQALLARPLLTLCVAGAILGALGVTNHEVWTPDEPRDAAVGAEMWRAGSWAVPRLDGRPFLEKPPLYWWVQASVFAAFGRADAGLARVPSALFGFGTLLLTYALGRRFFSGASCLLGGLVLLTTTVFTYRSHWIIVDPALLFAITGTLACLVHALDRSGAARSTLLAGMYAGLAMAFFAKGVVGVAIPGLGALVYLVWTGRLRRFVGWHLAAGALLVGALAAVWLWRVAASAGSAVLYDYLVHEHVGRLFPTGIQSYRGGHERPWWYYAYSLPLDLLPWTPLVPLAGLAARRGWRLLDERERDGIRFCVATTVPVVVALSFAGTKRGLYLLPIVPSVALLLGWWMASALERAAWEERFARRWSLAVRGFALVLPASALALGLGNAPWALAGMLVVAAALLGTRALAARSPAESWLGTVAVACAGLAAFLVFVLPPLDGYKSFMPFVEVLRREVREDHSLHTFQPSETTQGVVSFYLGRSSTPLPSVASVAALARDGRPAWLIVEDRRKGRGDYALIAEAKIPHRVVATQVIGPRRTLKLLALGTEGSPSPGETPRAHGN
jgi:4-amino-4-deoxy-L-arabinose transferase-like glycosyltransferase